MRSSLTLAAVCGAIAAVAFATEAASAAGAGSFCLSDREGRNDCSFTSLAQCQASASGTDAGCYAMPQFLLPLQGPAAPAQGRRVRGAGSER